MEIYIVNALVIVLLFLALFLTLLTLPGNLLIFLIAVACGFYDDFQRFDMTFLLMLFGGLAFGEIAEFAAGALGAKRQNASKKVMAAAVFGAIAGGLAGTALLPVLGSFLGAMLGAYAASYYVEFSSGGDAARANKVAMSVLKGQVAGTVVKLAVAVAMIVAIIVRLGW